MPILDFKFLLVFNYISYLFCTYLLTKLIACVPISCCFYNLVSVRIESRQTVIQCIPNLISIIQKTKIITDLQMECSSTIKSTSCILFSLSNQYDRCLFIFWGFSGPVVLCAGLQVIYIQIPFRP